MRAIDTNVLVAAASEASPHHETANDLLKILSEEPRPWAIPWPCIYEFLRVVTHPRIMRPPIPMKLALKGIDGLTASPSLRLLHETPRHEEVMREVLEGSAATGNLVHDAHIVALCLEHGVREILTGDRDFARFSGLTIVNPFAS